MRRVNLTLMAERLDQAVSTWRSHDHHCRPVRRTASEGEAQPGCEENGENEDPKHRLGLAKELPVADPRELDERVIGPAPPLSHRADSCQ
jgi:hypothetical protein